MGTRLVKIFCWGALLAVLTLGTPAWAVTTEWTGNSDTDWSNGDNWSNGVPESSFDVFINTGDEGAPPPYNPLISTTFAEAWNLSLGESSGQFGNLSINNDLSVGDVLTVGGTHDKTSTVNHTAGTVTADTLILGRDNTSDHIGSPNPQNFYHMGGGDLEVTTASIGDGGIGYLAPQAGTRIVVSEDLTLGNQPSGSGMLDKTDGEIEVYGSLYVGNQGAGHYWHNDGTTTVYQNLIVGDTGYGYMSQAGGTLTAESNEFIGFSGLGTFTQSGGIHTINGIMVLGHEAGGQGTYTLQNGGTLEAQSITVGLRGTGEFNQEGGSLTVNDTLSVQ
jgi:hypothetical protein